MKGRLPDFLDPTGRPDHSAIQLYASTGRGPLLELLSIWYFVMATEQTKTSA